MKYATSLVTFVDILGFRDIVSRKSADEIATILRRLISTAKPFGFNARPEDVSFVNFSDNIVRVSALPDNPRYEDIIPPLFIEAADLASAQALLAQRGVFVRGGICMGDIILSENMLYGPGLVKAYELESKVAQAPRIIIDPDLIAQFDLDSELFEADFDEGMPEEFEIQWFVSRDSDGLYFIDYLRGVCTEADDAEGAAGVIDLFTNHRRCVVQASREAPPQAKAKYDWLRDYHNGSLSVIRTAFLEHFGRRREEFLCP